MTILSILFLNSNTLVWIGLFICVIIYIMCLYKLRSIKRKRKIIRRSEAELMFSDFRPDEELVQFASQFAIMYQEMVVGNYSSPSHKYNIRYMDDIFESENVKSITNARINSQNGLIDLSKNKLIEQQLHEDYVFYIIIWCIILKDTPSIVLTDIKALSYYSSTNRSLNHVLEGMRKTVGEPCSEINTERITIIEQFIKAHG